MASQDLHSDIKTEIALNFQLIDTTEGRIGNIIDTQNYESIEFVWISGVITDGLYFLQFYHGDESDLSDKVLIEDQWMIGNAIKTFDDTFDNTTNRYGYSGKKRYVQCEILPSGITSGGIMGILMEKSNPRNAPIPDEHI